MSTKPVPEPGAILGTATVREKGRITIPQSIREVMHLEDGQVMQFVFIDESTIALRPVYVVDRDQAWIMKPEWQERIMEGIDDLRAGRSRTHKSDEDFLAALDD